MKRITALSAALLLGACASEPPPPEWGVAPIELPSGPGAVAPNLSGTTDGGALMSWIEPASGGGHELRFARRDAGGAWSDARTIARGDDWFVNWADFPAIVETADGMLVAHWLQKSGPATYAYDVMVVHSTDGGATWSEPFRPHEDGTQTEHGFVSLLPLSGGGVQVVWLDGRETHGGGHAAHVHGGHDAHHGRMTLRTRFLGPDGTWGGEELLDRSVCDCCQTSAVETPRGVAVAYRGRTTDEHRDIWFAVREAEAWTLPRLLNDDGWQITACPVNGPMLAAADNTVIAAWFTAADGDARVKTAFSLDGGGSFLAPLVIDDARPLGRVASVMLDDGSALVSWLASTEGADAEIRMRRVHPQRGADPHFVAARSAAARASGFPRIVRAGEGVLAVWTEPGEPGGLQGALIAPSAPRGR